MAQKGHQGFVKNDPDAGRPPGSKNKVSRNLKDSFLYAFEEMGGADALMAWGKQAKNKKIFYGIVAKLFPKEITGAGGTPLIPRSGKVVIVRLPDNKRDPNKAAMIKKDS